MDGYNISLDEVEKFLQGYDNEKYIVNIEYDKDSNTVYRIIDDPEKGKIILTDKLESFMFIKDLSSIRKTKKFYTDNYGNNQDAKLKLAMDDYGIKITPLRHDNQERLVDGFKFLLTCTQGYKKMLDFFWSGGINVFEKHNDINKNFLLLNPVEQYLISTGKRLFKGYEDLNDVHRMVFDLETTGLDPKTEKIFQIGIKTNKGFEEVLEVDLENPNSEREAIIGLFLIIDHIKPSIIGGYNSAHFDWEFIKTRCEILNLDITEIAKTLHKDFKLNTTIGTLKLGGDVEKYEQVNMFGYNIIDIMHSTRRAQAIDSNMKYYNLKYMCTYSKIAKKNRVYIKGDKISSMWKDNKSFYFEDVKGTYCNLKPEIQFLDFINREYVKSNPNKIFIFGDNEKRVGLGGQAKEMRNEPNSIGIITKYLPDTTHESYFSDDKIEYNKKLINIGISEIIKEIQKGKTIVFPKKGIGTGLAAMNVKAPKTFEYLIKQLKALRSFINQYKEVNGRYIVERYLMDDLWETLEIDNIYNQTSFMLAKVVPTTYQKVSTMGTASLWKLIMTAWSYEKQLAIPKQEPIRDFVGGLSRLFKVGFSTKLRKFDFDSLYPAIQLANDVFPKHDISMVMKSLLKFFHKERFAAKDLAKKYKKEGDKKKEAFYKKKQLPLKIFINSMFGALGAPNAFPWSDIDSAEGITCRARQYLRLMVKFFMDRGYDPLVLDTDGVNFKAPDNEDDYKYKDLVGLDAVLKEFNDKFMVKEMGLGFDGSWPSTINLSRKNYALLEDDGNISLTGNSIKSKKMPTYIEEFLDNGIELLLDGKGYDFVNYYYSYVDKIWNCKIPLAKIATKAKVKKSIENYLTRGTNKNGDPLPKQAHMELAIKNNLNVNLGDVIYYVNNGTKKSHGDVATNKDGEIYSKLVENEIIENNPETSGEYNVPKYLEMFNKRISSLLVCFQPEIRDKILIKNPEEKRSWLKSELELCSGQPDNETSQDSLEVDLFTVDPRETAFWDKYQYNPDIWFDDEIIFKLPGLDIEVPV